MCAGTVVTPPGDTSALTVSITSRSRSVALNASLERSARISTLARIGMVLRRSTTRWTWDSDLRSSARSTVTFMRDPARWQVKVPARGGEWSRRGYPAAGSPRRTTKLARTRRLFKGEAPHACESFLQLPFQGFDLLGQGRIAADEVLDLAHGVQDRGVVASAEAAADLRQRPQGQCLRQVHGDLPRADHIGGAARRQKIAAADVVVARDHALDVLDLDPLGLLRPDQVADLALGEVHGDRLAGELAVGEEAVERAFEIAAVMGDGLGDIRKHRLRHVKARMMRTRERDARIENLETQLLAERAHLDHEPAGEARAHALVEAFQVERRTVGRDDDLSAAVDQRVERMGELRLGGLALEELQIVDHQHVDPAQALLEGDRRLAAQRRHEAVHEPLRRQVEDLAVRLGVAGPGDRLQQMRLAETHARVDVERVEHDRIVAARDRDLLGGGVRKRVGAADHEAVEGQPRVEWRAAVRLLARRDVGRK